MVVAAQVTEILGAIGVLLLFLVVLWYIWPGDGDGGAYA